MAACAAYFAMGPARGKRSIAAVGILVGLAMILMKVIPVLPGHFSRYEWMALLAWIVLGASLNLREKTLARSAASH